jgi:predicted dinucleotide-binding enzyme
MIGIIGAGPVGRSLAVLLDRAGHTVRVGTRHPAAARVHGLPETVGLGTLEWAAQAGVVVIAVRHRAAASVAAMLRDALAGKVVIDTMNAWMLRDYLAAGLPSGMTEGCWLAAQLPGAHVVRAFSHIDWELIVPSATTEPGRWAIAYAADAYPAAATVEALIDATGYVPVHIGTLAESGPLDVGGVLWPYMFTPDDMREVLAGTRSPASGRLSTDRPGAVS